MHLTLRRAAFWALGVAGLVVALPQSSHSEEFPGLPDSPGAVYNNSAQGGLAYATRAKQWLRSPEAMVTFTFRNVTSRTTECDPSCVKYVQYGSVSGKAFIVSPDGAPAPYGYLAPVTVRSVGFGLMPVEATVQISQRREGGFPIPLVATLPNEQYFDTSVQANMLREVSLPSPVEDAMNVQILKVLVDGVDLGLTGDCRTVTPAPMTLNRPRFVVEDPDGTNPDGTNKRVAWMRNADAESYFSPEWGGTLRGTIDIPPFTGCTTASGDDLSELMTLSASGPDNPIAARVGWRCAVNDNGSPRPLRQGENTPKAAQAATAEQPPENAAFSGRCDYGTQKFEYPTRDAD